MANVKTINAKPGKLLVRQEKNIRMQLAGEVSVVMGRVVEQAKGELMRRKRDDNGKVVRDQEGEFVMERCEMTPMEMKASEIFLRKCLPDLSMVQQVESDSTDGMSRGEISDSIQGLLENNPQLAQVSGLLTAINNLTTVKTIEPT